MQCSLSRVSKTTRNPRVPPAHPQTYTATQNDVCGELAELKKKYIGLERKAKETADDLASKTKDTEELQGKLSDALAVCTTAVENELGLARTNANLQSKLRT